MVTTPRPARHAGLAVRRPPGGASVDRAVRRRRQAIARSVARRRRWGIYRWCARVLLVYTLHVARSRARADRSASPRRLLLNAKENSSFLRSRIVEAVLSAPRCVRVPEKCNMAMVASSNMSGHIQKQLTRSLERILEEAHLSGELKLSGRKLKDFPKVGKTGAAAKYNLQDTVTAGEFLSIVRCVDVCALPSVIGSAANFTKGVKLAESGEATKRLRTLKKKKNNGRLFSLVFRSMLRVCVYVF